MSIEFIGLMTYPIGYQHLAWWYKDMPLTTQLFGRQYPLMCCRIHWSGNKVVKIKVVSLMITLNIVTPFSPQFNSDRSELCWCGDHGS